MGDGSQRLDRGLVGRPGADAYPTLLAGVAGVAMRTALHRWFASDFVAALPDLVDEAWDLLTAGLPAPH